MQAPRRCPACAKSLLALSPSAKGRATFLAHENAMTERPDIAAIRRDYSRQQLNLDDCAATPEQQFQGWLNDALAAQVQEPTAMNLATVDAHGRPSARIVLLKGVDENHFIFYSNYHSRKGEQLAHNAAVALTFFWPELERQVRIEGRATRTNAAQSDAYFAERPYQSRIGAWASLQSRVLENTAVLMARAEKFSAQYPHQVPRPPEWGGYKIAASRVEFWQGRPSRLHDRVVYLRGENTAWIKERLYP